MSRPGRNTPAVSDATHKLEVMRRTRRKERKAARLYATIAPAVLDMLPKHQARACLVVREDGTTAVIGSPHYIISDWVDADMPTGRKLRLIRLGAKSPDEIPAHLATLTDTQLDALLLLAGR